MITIQIKLFFKVGESNGHGIHYDNPTDTSIVQEH
jgi:hypothetical protein